jgi:hypothetical protein
MSVRRNISRRDFLKAGSAGAALLGVGLAAGCSDEEDAATRSPDSKAKSGAAAGSSSELDSSIAEHFTKLTRETEWRRTGAVPVKFRTYHPQGMTRVGDSFFVSSVETIVEPEEYEEPRDGYDRSAGEGVGHLFEFGMDGELFNQTELGEGTIYHPGGIDYDGEHIWVPVAEYRPDSRSIVYRVDPNTLKATEVFRFPDHIGGVLRNTEENALHGVSWGSRRLYRWTLDDSLEAKDADRPPEELSTPNRQHYIDYQDCQYLGSGMALCSGVVVYETPKDPEFYFGGIDLVDLRNNSPAYQIPVTLWTEDGLVMTLNPFFVEERDGGLRFYFMPEDDDSRLFIYDV